MLAWLRLLRISALPSAISNILLGYLIVHNSWMPWQPLALLILASSCLYLAGMVFNDVFDHQRDLEQRPNRPIPSGSISLSAATFAYTALMGVAAVCGLFLGWRSLLVIAGIIVCVFLYNAVFKASVFGPIFMGSCRVLNIVLGGSVLPDGIPAAPQLLWWVALSVGILITGLTLFAKYETRNNSRHWLIGSSAVIVAGITMLASTGWACFPEAKSHFIKFACLVGLICVPALIRIIAAISKPEPKLIQGAVIALLRSLILLDAAVCFLVAPVVYCIVVMALLFPAMFLSRVIPPT